MFKDKKILIVEDDDSMLTGLRDNFTMRGAVVFTANEGALGLRLALEKQPDLILLDIMLPGMNGYEICQKLREHGCIMPIFMLTAKNEEENLVLGFDVGADDYIAKPFSLRELLSRCQAVLRRSERTHQCFKFGAYKLDINSHQLFKGNEEIQLMPKEFAMLAYLLKNQGCALSREDILTYVWKNEVTVTTRSVDRCVNTLRSKIEKKPDKPQFIDTIRNVGYRFNQG